MVGAREIRTGGGARWRSSIRGARWAVLLLAGWTWLASPGLGLALASSNRPPEGGADLGARDRSSGAPAEEMRLSDRLPLKRDDTARGPGWTWVRVATLLGALGVVAGALLVLRSRGVGVGGGAPGRTRRWAGWLRRRTDAAGLRRIEVLRLTPRAALHVVRWKDRELLIATSDGGVQVLLTGICGAAGAGPASPGATMAEPPRADAAPSDRPRQGGA